MEKFDRVLSHTIDSTLGLRSKVYGYQYSEILRSLMCVYFCGGSCVEDVSSHLMGFSTYWLDFSPKASGFYPFGDATDLAGEGGVGDVVWLIQASA